MCFTKLQAHCAIVLLPGAGAAKYNYFVFFKSIETYLFLLCINLPKLACNKGNKNEIKWEDQQSGDSDEDGEIVMNENNPNYKSP